MPTVDQLIENLQSFQKRTKMYVDPVDVRTVQGFLNGFEFGCHACGYPIDRACWLTALEARGWDRDAIGPVPQMERKGMSEAEIIDELVEIEILIIRQMERRGISPPDSA